MAKSKTDGMSYPWENNYKPAEAGAGDWNMTDQPRYSNDVADGWIRGHGGAEGKPGFMATPSGKVRGATGDASTTKPGGGPNFTGGAESGVGRLEKRTRGVR